MDDDNDGGLREWEENRFRRADEDARLLEEHRKWLKAYWLTMPNGFGLTKLNNEEKEV